MEQGGNCKEGVYRLMTVNIVINALEKFYIKQPDKSKFMLPRKKKMEKAYAVDKNVYPEFYRASRFLDIKKCPCGKMRARYSTKDYRWIVFCEECEFSTKRYLDFDDALEEWNRMATALRVVEDL